MADNIPDKATDEAMPNNDDDNNIDDYIDIKKRANKTNTKGNSKD